MSLLSRFADKPQYVFHPTRAARRAWRSIAPGAADDPGSAIAQLPWGLPLNVSKSDAIGYSILTGSVFDPCVSETVHRLVDPGDLVLDIGANVGYLTSLAAVRAGTAGQVIAYEPHPRVFEMLSGNVASWAAHPGVAPVELHEAALSDHAGEGELAAGPLHNANMGLSALQAPGTAAVAEATVYTVPIDRLDDVVGDRSVGLLKIDVEGHELEVLRGGVELLRSGRVRDLIFEDHQDYPNEATKLVEGSGMTLFSLENNLLGVRMVAPQDRGEPSLWPGPSYLATRDPARARERFAARGWQIRGVGPSLPWRR
jgi:FkbM family methyltransferase